MDPQHGENQDFCDREGQGRGEAGDKGRWPTTSTAPDTRGGRGERNRQQPRVLHAALRTRPRPDGAPERESQRGASGHYLHLVRPAQPRSPEPGGRCARAQARPGSLAHAHRHVRESAHALTRGRARPLAKQAPTYFPIPSWCQLWALCDPS